MNPGILICADDYAQNWPISEGVVRLVQHQRINAVSCMVNSKIWPEAYLALKPYSNIYIGLHLNLTFGSPLSAAWQNYFERFFDNLGPLLKKCLFGPMDAQVLAAEIQAQIQAFVQVTGQLADFIDGHQHIHQFPKIRDVLLALHAHQPITSFFRSTSTDWRDLFSQVGFPKPQAIALLGGIAFKKLLVHSKIPTNATFSGIYPFKYSKRYPQYFRNFLSHTQPGGMIMCHPGIRSDDLQDPLRLHRQNELDYFLGDAFLKNLDEAGLALSFKS